MKTFGVPSEWLHWFCVCSSEKDDQVKTVHADALIMRNSLNFFKKSLNAVDSCQPCVLMIPIPHTCNFLST